MEFTNFYGRQIVNETKKYIVVGGQYGDYIYGCYNDLRTARIVAGENMEYWDNYQGWHKPHVFETSEYLSRFNIGGKI